MPSNNSASQINSNGKAYKNDNGQDKTRIILAIITVIGPIIAAYFGYLGVKYTIEGPSRLTQTAEARLFSPLPTITFASKTEMPSLVSPTSTSTPMPTETSVTVTPLGTLTLAPSKTASSTPIPSFTIHITDLGDPNNKDNTDICKLGQNMVIKPYSDSIILDIETDVPGEVKWKVRIGVWPTGEKEVIGKRAVYSRPATSANIDSIQVFQNEILICEIKINLDD